MMGVLKRLLWQNSISYLIYGLSRSRPLCNTQVKNQEGLFVVYQSLILHVRKLKNPKQQEKIKVRCDPMTL